jgi:predicted MFS family arabinose efflux permease
VTFTPAPAADVRRAYVNQAAISYSFYVVGAATAFVAAALSLSDTQAGLHSSAMAVGMITAGSGGERFDRALGVRRVQYAAMALLALSLVALAWAPALWVTLAASLGIGLGAGLMFGHVNQTLGAGGGVTARVRLTRGALVAKTSQLMVPLAIGAGIAVGFDWRFVVVPVLAFVGLLAVWMRRSTDGTVLHTDLGRLPWAYWLPWMLTVSVIAMEFFVIVWGGPLIERQAGVSLADATLTISAFIAGMIAGRALMSLGSMGRLDPMRVIRAGIVITLAAVLLPWSGDYLLGVGGMLVAGFGIGILYPPAASIALAAVPGQPAAASSRLTLAAGLAILVAPLLLGIVADVSDIATAWLLVPGVCLTVLLLTVPVERARRERARVAST